MNAANSGNHRNGGNSRAGLLVALAGRPTGLRRRLEAGALTTVECQAVPMTFLPPYARRFQAYRTNAALRGYNGWER